jgi:hypothetical protein
MYVWGGREGDREMYRCLDALKNLPSPSPVRCICTGFAFAYPPSLSPAFGFHHPPFEVFYSEDESSYVICDPTGEDKHCSNQYYVDTSIKDHLNYLGTSLPPSLLSPFPVFLSSFFMSRGSSTQSTLPLSLSPSLPPFRCAFRGRGAGRAFAGNHVVPRGGNK